MGGESEKGGEGVVVEGRKEGTQYHYTIISVVQFPAKLLVQNY